MLSVTQNSDYYAKGIPAQTSQQTIKQCVRDMKSFFAAIKDYKENPSRYTGKPKLPGYHKKGGHTMAILTNQDVRLIESLHGYEAKLLLTKLRMQVGALPSNLTLKEVRILPNNGSYLMTFIFTFPQEKKQLQKPKRIAAIDLGVRNLMSVTNNCGMPCLLYRGGVVKSVNQHYNKKIATIMSKETIGSKKKFIPTDEYYKVTIKRNDQILDFMHKVAKHLILWCVENRIDTLVVGENKYWKQEVSLGYKENQKFVQIPFDTLKEMLAYLAQEQGIRFVRTEESYTSKASFVDGDPIPVYNEEEPKQYSFSGVRGPKSYKGNVRKQGFHGLYQTKDGTIMNSDLNGSANILRKAYPHAFDNSTVDFNNVQIIIHPDYEKQQRLQVRQKEGYVVSHAKKKRLNRKQVA